MLTWCLSCLQIHLHLCVGRAVAAAAAAAAAALPPPWLTFTPACTDDEIKTVIAGELHIFEPATGTKIVAKVGDVLNIANGAALEFNSPDKAKVFVSRRAPHPPAHLLTRPCSTSPSEPGLSRAPNLSSDPGHAVPLTSCTSAPMNYAPSAHPARRGPTWQSNLAASRAGPCIWRRRGAGTAAIDGPTRCHRWSARDSATAPAPPTTILPCPSGCPRGTPVCPETAAAPHRTAPRGPARSASPAPRPAALPVEPGGKSATRRGTQPVGHVAAAVTRASSVLAFLPSRAHPRPHTGGRASRRPDMAPPVQHTSRPRSHSRSRRQDSLHTPSPPHMHSSSPSTTRASHAGRT